MKKINILFQQKEISDEEVFDTKSELNQKYPLDTTLLIFIRALEHNNAFQQWLSKMRKHDGIPTDGYSLESKSKNEGKRDIKYIYAFDEKDLQYLIDRLPLKYKYYLDEDDWKNIVLWNCLDMKVLDENFFITPTQPELELADNYAFILRFNKRFNKKELHEFIDREWDWIERYLPDPDNREEEKNRLSEKDIFLLDRREYLGMKFGEIDKIYPDKFKKRGVTYTEENMKTIHKRAKEKVKKLLDLKNKYPHKISSMFDFYKKSEK
jgi:hypothetical protein